MKKRYVFLPIVALLSCVVSFSGHDVYAGEGCTEIIEVKDGVVGSGAMGEGFVKETGDVATGTLVKNNDATYDASLNGTTPGTDPSSRTEQTTTPDGTTTTITEITNSSSNTKPGGSTVSGGGSTNGNNGDSTNSNTGGSTNENNGDSTINGGGHTDGGSTNGNNGDSTKGNTSGSTAGNGNNKGNGGSTNGNNGDSTKGNTSGSTAGNGNNGDSTTNGGSTNGENGTKKPTLTKDDLIKAGVDVDTKYVKIEVKINGKTVSTIIMVPGKDGTVWESNQQQEYPSQTTTDTEENMDGWEEEEKKLDYASWAWKNTTNKDWIKEYGDNYRSMGTTTAGTTLKWTLGHGKYDDGTWSIVMTPHYNVKYSKKVIKTIVTWEEYDYVDANGNDKTGRERVENQVEDIEYKTKKETGTSVEYQVTVPLICGSCPQITICIKGELDDSDGDVEVKDDDKGPICDCGDPYTKCDDAGEPKYTVKYHSELSQ